MLRKKGKFSFFFHLFEPSSNRGGGLNAGMAGPRHKASSALIACLFLASLHILTSPCGLEVGKVNKELRCEEI